jgi:hypothetical protein
MNNEPVAWGWYDLEIKRFFPHWDEDLMENKEGCIPLYTHSVKELTNEEINIVAILQDAEIVPVGHEIWKTDEEFNKYKKIVLATAKALRKAQEK